MVWVIDERASSATCRFLYLSFCFNRSSTAVMEVLIGFRSLRRFVEIDLKWELA